MDSDVIELTQTDRLRMTVERLASNKDQIVKVLQKAGYHNLALQTRHDIENLMWRFLEPNHQS